MDRRLYAAASVAGLLLFGSMGWAQEHIEPLGGRGQQQEIEILQPTQQQQVEAVDGTAQQEVRRNEIPTETQRAVSRVGKVMVGIFAAAVAIGASAASLLLL